MNREIVTVGLDLAKNVFQVHAIGSDGEILARRKSRRAEEFASSRICHPAWSAWKPVHRRITGHAS